MARVVLITTGKMEEKALAASLHRIFPAHDFIPTAHLTCFTSAPLPPTFEPRLKRFASLNKFANTLIGRIAGGRTDEPPADFVIGIDDVELANARAPERITQSLRDALADNLTQWDQSRDEASRRELRASLAARCSFHLMAPMTESYFFGDPAALARATTPGAHHPCGFDPTTLDVEEFYVDDPPFLTPPVPEKRDRYDWRTANRELHPKHYLEYLTDEALTGRGRYDELAHGAPALADLDWALVLRHDLARPTAFARFARSLLADLTDMLASPPRGISTADLSPDHCHPLTRLSASDHLLRNL